MSLLPQNQGYGSDEHIPSFRIHKLPYEVLVEIFDFYRQTIQHEPNHQRIWNGRNGWYKLAHVCREWRQVLLSSPSRLHVKLLFTMHRTKRGMTMTRLPHLPIIVDYSDGVWTVEAQNHMISALAYPDRVCAIAFRGRGEGLKKLLDAMNRPFPALESLEFDFRYNQASGLLPTFSPGLTYPPPSLENKPPPLRRLIYTGRADPLLFQILSHTKSLVELTMCVDRIVFSPQRSALLAHLQDMPFLRHVKVEMWLPPLSSSALRVPDGVRRHAVLLSKLTSLRIIGHCIPVDALIPELSTPSLQEFHVTLHHESRTFHIPHLSEFIRDAGIVFCAAQVKYLPEGVTISLLTQAHSIADPPFNITASGQYSVSRIGVALSSIVGTVEDVFLTIRNPSLSFWSLFRESRDVTRWHVFFSQFRNVKILRVHEAVGRMVAHMLRQGGPPQSVPNILPSLEDIEIQLDSQGTPISESERASRLDWFGPFVHARQKIGRPVKVYYNTDRVLPTYFYDPN